MAIWEPETPEGFPVHRQYLLLAVGLATLSLLMGYAYSQTRDTGLLIMTLICSGLALWHGQWAGTSVQCDSQNLTLRRWGRAEVSLQWRQVHSLSLAGRLTRGVLVEYGDPAAPESLLLPKLQGQEALLASVSDPNRPAQSKEDA